MSTVIQPAPIRRTLQVKADPQRAFSAFTSHIGSWWPRRMSIGSAPQADVILEPRAGGRWYERGADGTECEWGKVLVWEPPLRLVLAWQIDSRFHYDPALITEVELRFTALAVGGTQVDFEHRHLERLGDDAATIRGQLDSGWPGILDSYRQLADADPGR
jgi:uncharacterized protein YndB with AHSA1/START domain